MGGAAAVLRDNGGNFRGAITTYQEGGSPLGGGLSTKVSTPVMQAEKGMQTSSLKKETVNA